MPKFSILLPTRERSDTLRFALQTAVAQDLDDVEILVHESGDDPLTAEVVAEVGDYRTRHVKTSEPVAMKENWERAVAAATGDYLTIIGDDDGILAGACSEAARILDRYPVEVLTWRPAGYFWPESAVTVLRNRLQAYLPKASGFERQDPRTLLHLAYHFREHHYTMPMILHSFVGRPLVDRVIEGLGSYFSSAAPDIASAVADAWFGESCILSYRPLSISGISHHSTGSRMHFSRDLKLRKEAEEAAFATSVEFHPSLPNSRNSQIFAANEMMTMKQALFPNDEPSLNYRALIQRALDTLETGFDDYESGLGDIRRTAELNGIDMDDFKIPAPGAGGSRTPAGVTRIGDALLVDVDCAGVGLTDVAGATGLLASVLPPFEPPGDLPEPPVQLGVISRPFPADGLRFSWDGNGQMLLGSGWARNEPWGVWSTGKKADLTLRLEPGLDPCRIIVSGRMFRHHKTLEAGGRALINGRRAAELTATEDQPSVTFCIDVTPDDLKAGTVLLEFLIDAPTSPAEAGMSADTRSLGFGLERIILE
jgi:glycosyltransferase involved in cell wall biosynthesis